MARRLDKIEKEMGYCEIKLEKERRLRKQIAFLQSDIDALEKQISDYSKRGIVRAPVGRAGEAGAPRRPSREEFMAAGLLDIVQEERDILQRELEDLAGRLHTFSGFEMKRSFLEEEKRSALRNLAPAHSSKLRRLNDDFKKIEWQWNSLTEDLLNLDEGIFFLDRNLDYLRSCRTFLISAKGGFDIDGWISRGYLSDLFRHSSIGRAKEMADGADRNLKMAQKELVCVASARVRVEPFQRVLEAVLQGLFTDIYVENKLQAALEVVEAALATNLRLTEQVKSKREVVGQRLEQTEKIRTQLFSRMGVDRRGRMVG